MLPDEPDLQRRIEELEAELLASRQYLGTVRGVDMIEQLETEREIADVEAKLLRLRRRLIGSWGS